MDGHYIGLMSGTSMDAIDAALVEFSGNTIALKAQHSLSLPICLRERLLAASHDSTTAISLIAELDVQLGRLFAEAALKLLSDNGMSAANIRAIGSHGQTVYHYPQGNAPTTLQIGDPNIIAELSGITTVGDFRRRDIAAGGQGAPLVPAFHNAIFRSPVENRVVINIGGIANLTVLPRDAALPVRGFDSGPGNVLMDFWIYRHRGMDFDYDGAWAAAGQVRQDLLGAMLNDGYFSQPPPKSTGREHFNPNWLAAILRRYDAGIAAVDVQATLCELTALSLAQAVEQHASGSGKFLVCGGGVYNKALMTRLNELLAPRIVETTERHGIGPKWVEAMAFAWLARQNLRHLSGNLPAVTGAHRSVVLGAVYPGAVTAIE